MFYLKDYFIDAREMFNDNLSPKPNYKQDAYNLIDFQKTDKIKVIFDKSQFVADETGLVPGNQGLYYPANLDTNRVSIRLDLENVEVVEFLDVQAFSGCLDHKPHPTNLAVSRFDPKQNVKEVTYTIRMPCRRYFSVPSYPYESVLMVKVKTSKGYYYTIHKLYSASRDECLRLWCKKSKYE
ncbi:MAG: hypothetical protein HY080_06880 [Gammaproteobacteria bacterium]|nr:hypothetical protein [Gammaproteobacteria bacterium]